MLNSSPRIYIPPESDFIPLFFGRDPEEELSEARIANLLGTIFSDYRLVKEWQGDPPVVADFVRQMPGSTPAAFLDTLYGMYARQYGAVRWGDKTPIYASYLDLIHRIFPQAQFVHIIRDGRDVALSMLDKWGQTELHVDLYFAARSWLRRIRQARRIGIQLGSELYYEMRYEHLVGDPEVELRSLCNFLSETYVPDMARPHLLGRERIQLGSFHEAIREPPSSSRTGRWRREMSLADQRLFQHVAGDLLIELGYDLFDVGTMAPMEFARLTLMRAKYVVLQTGRRVLQSLGVFPPN
jgi:hypothetical protein